jgi:superfamily I DNA/RNA helicase
MQNWLVHRTELTDEQLRAVELYPDEHRLIFGAPGSGKTQILLHRAAFLKSLLGTRPDSFRIFVFTNSLKQYIQSAMEMLELPEECILTFDDWCKKYFIANINKRTPWDAVNKSPDYAAIRHQVREKLRSTTGKKLYDFVLVDEGQDLDRDAFDTICHMADHVTVCMDNKQQIYETGSNESDILAMLGLRKRNVSLLSAFRCCPFIVKTASRLIADPVVRDNYLNQAKTIQTERQKPLLYFSADEHDEKTRLIDIIKTRQNLGERIAVLYPQKRLVYGYAKGFMEAGLEVEVPLKHGKSSEYLPIDFNSDRPKLMPYHSAKGLTFDTVIMPRLQPGAFGRMQGMVDKLLFVGITRATKWVYLSSRFGDALPILTQLQNPPSDDFLTIQDSKSIDAVESEQEVSPSTGGLSDLL